MRKGMKWYEDTYSNSERGGTTCTQDMHMQVTHINIEMQTLPPVTFSVVILVVN